ncbi:MAG: zinc dependent phospholipase C family protein [Proteobacteria bacterium]|nr:zinc dependent phospholipase C family protein [Pseudomonadota bacterium]
MSKLTTIILAALALLLALPGSALAWGPGMHLAAGSFVLDNLTLVTPFVGELVAAHRRAFLYGCLSADIFIGKGSTFRPGHSHNWATGFRLLETVTDPRLMAYAYGYLTHLAADTVAHNHYVPGLLAVAPASGTTSHVYFEMQADARMHWDRDEARGLFRTPDKSADGLLLSATRHRRWPFQFQKRLMLGGLALFGRKPWNDSLSLAERILPTLNYESYLNRMSRLSFAAVIDCLNNPVSSPVIELDPIGSQALARVRMMRFTDGRSRIHDLGRHFPVAADLCALPLPAVPLCPVPSSNLHAHAG